MRRILTTGFILVALVGFGGLERAAAAEPTHFSDEVDVTFPLGYYSHLCGFPVRFRLSGRIDSAIFFDQSGSIVREVDTQPGARETFSSPYGSFSFPFASTLVTTYASGDAIGATAVATGEGLGGKVPGIPADAGRITYQAEVVDISPAGIPIVGFDGIISVHGHSNDPAAADAAICSALAH